MSVDSILGSLYLDPTEFRLRSKAFGCNRALETLDSDNLIAILAAASRAIDIYVSRDPGSFANQNITETHIWNGETRRIIVNQPPISELVSVVIRTSPGTTSSFPVTPVRQDADGNNVSFGSFYYNRGQNWLEINSLALAGNLTSVLVSLGMTESVVELTYKSYASIPNLVAAACGFTAAHIANEYFSSQMAPGMKRVKTDNEEFVKEDLFSQDSRFIVPPSAARFLYNLSRINIG